MILTPLELLNNRYNEIDEVYQSSLKHGEADEKLIKVRIMYKASISALELFGFRRTVKSWTGDYGRKLDELQIETIRRDCRKQIRSSSYNSVNSFAVRYGVSKETILNVLNNKFYKKELKNDLTLIDTTDKIKNIEVNLKAS